MFTRLNKSCPTSKTLYLRINFPQTREVKIPNYHHSDAQYYIAYERFHLNGFSTVRNKIESDKESTTAQTQCQFVH